VVAAAVERWLGVFGVAVFAYPAAVNPAFAAFGSGDRVEALLDVGGDGDQSGEGFGGQVAGPAYVNVNLM